MLQAKFSLEESQIDFVNNYKRLGFKDKSTMVREALKRFKKSIELQSLKESADLYHQVYVEDQDLQELTESSVEDWPE